MLQVRDIKRSYALQFTYIWKCKYGCLFNSINIRYTSKEKHQFLNNSEKWNYILGKGMDTQVFDLIKYASIYSKMGCKVLMYGYGVIRDWILEHTELDVDSYITIQSLASSFMLESGCYENVFRTSGVLQQFLSRCVVGGHGGV